MGQLKPTFETGVSKWSGGGVDITVLPVQFGMRYLLQAHETVHFWGGVFFHGDFMFGDDAYTDHHVGGLASGGVELRLGRVVLGVESGYRFSQASYSNLIVGIKIGFTIGEMGRSRPPGAMLAKKSAKR